MLWAAGGGGAFRAASRAKPKIHPREHLELQTWRHWASRLRSPSSHRCSPAPLPPFPPLSQIRGEQPLCWRHFSRPCVNLPFWNSGSAGEGQRSPAAPPTSTCAWSPRRAWPGKRSCCRHRPAFGRTCDKGPQPSHYLFVSCSPGVARITENGAKQQELQGRVGTTGGQW